MVKFFNFLHREGHVLCLLKVTYPLCGWISTQKKLISHKNFFLLAKFFFLQKHVKLWRQKIKFYSAKKIDKNCLEWQKHALYADKKCISISRKILQTILVTQRCFIVLHYIFSSLWTRFTLLYMILSFQRVFKTEMRFWKSELPDCFFFVTFLNLTKSRFKYV